MERDAVGEIDVWLLVAGAAERFVREIFHSTGRLRAQVGFVARRAGIPEPPSKPQIQQRQYDLAYRRRVVAHVRADRRARDCGRSAERDSGFSFIGAEPGRDEWKRRLLFARVLRRAPIAETITTGVKRTDRETLRLALLPREPVRNRRDQVERDIHERHQLARTLRFLVPEKRHRDVVLGIETGERIWPALTFVARGAEIRANQ